MTNNIILCHPDHSGDPVAEVFGDVPDALMALFDEECDSYENRYASRHPHHRMTVDIGFRDVRKERAIRKTDEQYAEELANAVLYDVNFSPYLDTIRFHDPSWTSAIQIALERFDYGNEFHSEADPRETLAHVMKAKHRIGRIKEETYYEPELIAQNDALLHYLTDSLGFVWEWEGWDQEPRFIANGLVRVPGTKIVQQLDGLYVISPRCDRCGEKTGYCRCSESLGVMIIESGKPNLCNECCYQQQFEEAKAEYLKTGTIPYGFLDDLRDMAERIANEGSYKKDDREEIQFENDADAVAFLAEIYSGEQVDVMEWYEFIEKNWTVWVDLQDEHLEEVAFEDDDYCECPLGV